MTKRKDTLAETCRMMVGRCVWAIHGARGRPPNDYTDDELAELFTVVNSEDETIHALAVFALQRWVDASREGASEARETQSPIIRHQLVARAKEKAAHAHVQDAMARVRTAVELWAGKRTADAVYGSDDSSRVGELLAQARLLLQALDESILKVRLGGRFIPGARGFLPFEGLSHRQWQAALKEQAEMLVDAGVSVEHVAIICGWEGAKPKTTKRNASRRIKSKNSNGVTK